MDQIEKSSFQCWDKIPIKDFFMNLGNKKIISNLPNTIFMYQVLCQDIMK